MENFKIPIWKKKKPKGKTSKKLTKEQIEKARKRAFEAGRRYPNLIDNIWASKN